MLIKTLPANCACSQSFMLPLGMKFKAVFCSALQFTQIALEFANQFFVVSPYVAIQVCRKREVNFANYAKGFFLQIKNTNEINEVN